MCTGAARIPVFKLSSSQLVRFSGSYEHLRDFFCPAESLMFCAISLTPLKLFMSMAFQQKVTLRPPSEMFPVFV